MIADLGSEDFGIHSPHFKETTPTVIQTLGLVFPDFNQRVELRSILSLLLASAAYHEEWLRATLRPGHPILHNHLFRR